MERLSDAAIEIVNELHRERLDYNSEYLPLIDALNRLAAYEDTGLEPEKCATIAKSYPKLFDMVEELQRYRKAETEGRLLALPCKAGDTVYTAQRGVISELSVDHLELYNVGIWVGWHLISGIYGNFRMDGFPASDIGKTVFLTREEAEAKLKEE